MVYTEQLSLLFGQFAPNRNPELSLPGVNVLWNFRFLGAVRIIIMRPLLWRKIHSAAFTPWNELAHKQKDSVPVGVCRGMVRLSECFKLLYCLGLVLLAVEHFLNGQWPASQRVMWMCGCTCYMCINADPNSKPTITIT